LSEADDPARFIRENTALDRPPLVPEIALYLATEVTPIWQATENTLSQGAVPPPFWAFAWAGGQALARYLLDHSELVRGRTLFDFASGSGLVAVAAAMAGAERVTAADIDRFARAAIALNAAENGVAIAVRTDDPTAAAPAAADIVTAGDICYERAMAEQAFAWLRRCAACGSLVLLGDPGRTYLPQQGVVERARYLVPTSRELEGRESRDTVVYQVLPE